MTQQKGMDTPLLLPPPRKLPRDCPFSFLCCDGAAWSLLSTCTRHGDDDDDREISAVLRTQSPPCLVGVSPWHPHGVVLHDKQSKRRR
jgi:hypothetical protein